MADTVIWNEKNELVEPTMKANAEEFSALALQPTVYASEFYQDYDSAQNAQAEEGMTKEPMTSPQEVTDPNHMPTEITIPEESGSGGTTPSTPPAPEAPPPVEPESPPE
jgi:hypothetical protein